MKTYTIEHIVSPASRRVLGVQLTRYGKCVWSRQTKNAVEEVEAAWEARAEAGNLGATHVMFLGKRERVSA